MRRRWLALLVVACGSTDEGPLASLRAMAEVSLAYTGSAQLDERACDQETGSINGPQAAEFGRQFGTDASDAESHRASCIGSAWEKGNAFFRLSFRARDEQGRLDAVTLGRYPTVYGVRLQALPRSRPVRRWGVLKRLDPGRA